MNKSLLNRTENTPMIIGLGKAAELVTNNLIKYSNHMRTIRDYLEKRLTVRLNFHCFLSNICYNFLII